jgi:CRP-like cAMP-binding protein
MRLWLIQQFLKFTFYEFIQISNTNIDLSNLYNRILESIYISYEAKKSGTTALDATQRYLQLKRRIPNIENLITQYQIASYLNISRVQLSRIRKTLK